MLAFRVATFGIALSLVSPAVRAADAPPPRGPVKIFVLAIPPAPIDKSAVDALRKKADALDESFDASLKALKKQHGKDVKKWPDAVRVEFHKTLLERNQAFAASGYANSKQNDLEDSVENIVNSFGGKGLARKKEQVEVVDSRDEAQLVLEVVGRIGGPKFMRSPKYMTVVVRPGPKLPANSLEKLSWFWDDELPDVAPIHHPTPEEPWLQFQSWSMERWRDVANGISWVVNYVAKENYEILVPAK